MIDSVASGNLRPALAAALLAQRGHLLLWVPVCLALGIGIWFALPVEPGPGAYAALGAAGLGAAALGWRLGEAVAPLAWALALVAAGAGLAGLRAHLVAEPVLGFRYYGPVEGRVVGIDRSTSDALRLTLDRVRLDDVAPARTPTRVRVSLHGAQGFVEPEPGLVVILTGHLSPPGGPVEPGGFDFRRHAWFAGLGAVGYTRTPVLALAPAEAGRAGLAVFRLRQTLSHWIRERLAGGPGAFVAAILTGDRSALPKEDVAALRASNLAHLLAISGLHMGLLTGVVFAAVRLALACVPWLALRLPCKRIAAIVALIFGAAYLALSGGNVATVRAFTMVSVVLVAVLLGRRAISLRSVAVAATLILAATPEALLGPGFQMSFAATTALVAAFTALRDAAWYRAAPGWSRAPLATVISSAVAGLATAPIGAAHFNALSDYGLLANLLSVPVMGILVMPAALGAVVLAPFGLEWPAMQAMGLGAAWILGVADWVAGLEGAVTRVPAPPTAVLPLLSLGLLWALLWQGRARLVGLAPAAVALWLWTGAERPAVLIAESGRLVGVMTEAGRALNKPRGDGFAAQVWLENDGDLPDQALAAARASGWEDGRLVLAGLTLVDAKGAADGAACAEGELWLLPRDEDVVPEGPCLIYDAAKLRREGALALSPGPQGWTVETALARTGPRLWTEAGRKAQ